MEVDSKILKETQETLGKYIKKPQLTEKLLQKPPFRYLHDIVKAVIRDTGFLDGLFSADELDYEKVKDKESKIEFLNKLISVVKLASGIELTVRPSKIVSGQEAAKTNELLQAIAVCIEKKLSSKSDEVVKVEQEKKEIIKVEKKDAPKKKEIPQKIPKDVVIKATVKNEKTTKTNKNDPKIKEKEKKVTKITKENSKKKEKPVKSDVEPPKKPEREKTIIKQASIDNSSPPDSETKPSLETVGPESGIPTNVTVDGPEVVEKDQSPPSIEQVEQEIAKQVDSIEKEIVKVEEKSENIKKDSPKRSESGRARLRRQSTTDAREVSAQKGKFTKSSVSEDKITRLRPPSVRPPSARPGAPKRRDKNVVEIVSAVEEPRAPDVKIDSFDVELDENDDNLVIIENPTIVQDEILFNQKQNDGEQEGHLVQQILETQREFSNAGSTEPEYESPFDNKRISSAKTEALREGIQKLTKSVNPLGKLLDFMQEDVDSMQMELTQQMEMYQSALADLEQERSHTETVIQPFKQQLALLQENIKFYESTILDVRNSIIVNEQKIMKKLNEF